MRSPSVTFAYPRLHVLTCVHLCAPAFTSVQLCRLWPTVLTCACLGPPSRTFVQSC